MPMFVKLEVTSAYEVCLCRKWKISSSLMFLRPFQYLEKRFDRKVRLVASLIFSTQMVGQHSLLFVFKLLSPLLRRSSIWHWFSMHPLSRSVKWRVSTFGLVSFRLEWFVRSTPQWYLLPKCLSNRWSRDLSLAGWYESSDVDRCLPNDYHVCWSARIGHSRSIDWQTTPIDRLSFIYRCHRRWGSPSCLAACIRWRSSGISQVGIARRAAIFQILSRCPSLALILIRPLVILSGVSYSVPPSPGWLSTVGLYLAFAKTDRSSLVCLGFNQAQVQRYLCVPTVRDAKLFVKIEHECISIVWFF